MRSAHGLEAPRRDEHWSFGGRCRGNADIWSTETTATRQYAMHQCLAHCPVLSQCRRDVDQLPKDRTVLVVLAGVSYDTFGNQTSIKPAANCGMCPPELACRARAHNTLRAYDIGCRCSDTVALKREHWRKNAKKKKRREPEPSNSSDGVA